MATYRANYSPGNWIVVAGPSVLVLLEPDLKRAAPKLERIWGDVLTSTTLDELVASLVQWGPEAAAAAIFQIDENRMRLTFRGQAVILDANSGAVVADGGGSPVWRTVEPNTPYIQVNLGPDALHSQRVPLLMGIVGVSSFTLDARVGATEPRRIATIAGSEPMPAVDAAASGSVLDRFGLHGMLGISQPLEGWGVPQAHPNTSLDTPSSLTSPIAPLTPPADENWPIAPEASTWPASPDAPLWPDTTDSTPWPSDLTNPLMPVTPTETEPSPTENIPASSPSTSRPLSPAVVAAMAAIGLTPSSQRPPEDATPTDSAPYAPPAPAATVPTPAVSSSPAPSPSVPFSTSWPVAPAAAPVANPPDATGMTPGEAAWMASLDELRTTTATPPAASSDTDTGTGVEPAPLPDWPAPTVEPVDTADGWMSRAFAPAPSDIDNPAPSDIDNPAEPNIGSPAEPGFDTAAPVDAIEPEYSMSDIEAATQKLMEQLSQPLIADWEVEPVTEPDFGPPPVTAGEPAYPTTTLEPEPAVEPTGDAPADTGDTAALNPEWSFPAPPPECVLSFGGGMDVPIDGIVIIGRAPQAGANEHARLIKISSTTHGLSRSHVRIEPVSSGFLVTDMISTNGTAVQEPGRDLEALPPDTPTLVPVGTLIRLGGTIEARIEAA